MTDRARITIELVGGPACGHIIRDYAPGRTPAPHCEQRGYHYSYAPTDRHIEGRQVYLLAARIPLDTTHPAWLHRRDRP